MLDINTPLGLLSTFLVAIITYLIFCALAMLAAWDMKEETINKRAEKKAKKKLEKSKDYWGDF